MAYFTRVLGLKDPDIHLDVLLDAIEAEDLSAGIGYADGETPEKWSYLEITTDEKVPLLTIERNPVVDGELGKEELDEFREMLATEKPASAATWLLSYFNKVQVIYAFQLHDAAMEEENYPIFNAIRTAIWNLTGGVLQSDNEGFSNEDGYHILWQFDDDVTGEWSCAVLTGENQWTNFLMDLGDETQRTQYLDGKVPEKAHTL